MMSRETKAERIYRELTESKKAYFRFKETYHNEFMKALYDLNSITDSYDIHSQNDMIIIDMCYYKDGEELFDDILKFPLSLENYDMSNFYEIESILNNLKYISKGIKSIKDEELKIQNLKKNALNKLTIEEREVLGL